MRSSLRCTSALAFVIILQVLVQAQDLTMNDTRSVDALSTENRSVAESMNTMEAAARGFEENKGQMRTMQGESARHVRYRLKDGNTNIFLLENGIAYQFSRTHYPAGYAELMANAKTDPHAFEELVLLRSKARTETFRMDMLLEGADHAARVTTEGRSSEYTNYSDHGVFDVHSYTKVTYHAVYPGIDWVIRTTEEGMKYDFVIHPGADPSLIRLRFDHHEDLHLDPMGNLVHGNQMGHFTEERPVSFQDGHEVPTQFLLENDLLRFAVGTYDRTKSLTIDPARVWGTYYGGSDTDYGFNCITDGDGNVYLIGASLSNTAIASGGHQNTIGGGSDAMLVKFDENGTRIWSTYYGGTGDEQGVAAAVDATGNVYLIGSTASTSGIASGGHQSTFGGGPFDGFLVKFDSNGDRIWGTYYGGSGYDVGYSCMLDPSGDLLIAGYTNSTDAIAAGGHQNTYGGGAWDGFMAKFNASGTRIWGTYYGGSSEDITYTATPDAAGNIYLAGYTTSTNAISSGGHQNTIGGGTDAFLAKFNTSGSRIWGTYYGGAQNDVAYSCTVDPSGNAYLNGYTSSTSAIASSGHQNAFGGNVDGFLVKFNSSGGRSWGTYYGGTGADYGRDCATDVAGNVYLIGYTSSTSAIASGGHQNTYGGGISDAFLARFNPNGIRLWASYYGGSLEEIGFACTVDPEGNVYATGYSASTAAIALGGHQNTYGGGGYDAFLVKFRGGATQDCTGLWGGAAFVDACGTCAAGTTGLEPCDQYRSKQTGNWHLATTWERFNGVTWVDASTYPTASNSNSITVRSPHVVTLINTVGAIPMDDLVILAGGTLTLSDGCHNFNDDPLEPIDIRIFGTFNGDGACGSMGCCGTVSVESGGVINYNVDGSIFAPTIVQVGGTFNAPTATNALSAVTNHGTFTKTSGALTAQNFQNHGVLSISGGNLIINSVFTNSGTATITNAEVRLNQANATFNNSGTINLNGSTGGSFRASNQSGQVWTNSAGGVINVNNTSTPKALECCGPYNNAGTFNLNAGQLNQFTTFNHTGALNIGAGATFNQSAAGTNTGTISIASGGSLIGSMTPFLGSTLSNNGTVSITSLQFAGTASQTLAGSGSISTLNVNNPNGVLQTGAQTISTALLLTNGKITTGAGDLVLGPSASLTGGSATNYVATTGVGKFVRRVPVNTLTLFPVGTAVGYLPVRLTLATGSTADDYRVRAQADLSSSYDGSGIATGSTVTDRVVARSWFVSEAVGGGTNATIQLDWNIAEEGAAFDRSNSRVSFHMGGAWDLGPLASASGAGPYSRSRAGITALGTFTVSDAATFFGEDLCPGDANKTSPGECGCGTTDVPQTYYADTDGDGFGAGAAIPGFTCNPPANTATNNTDGCPTDALKQTPGACGCGNLETDSDGDGTPNCIDACPSDPLKIALGQCGCGNLDTDSDSDGTANCNDGCPADPLKITAGQCGCGSPDTDSDNDGIANCVDNCPNIAGQIGSACNDGNATTGNDAINGSCVCVGLLIDCAGTPGGSASPGTACTVSSLPGIWSAGCVCELEGPDVAVQNVSAPNDTISPEQTITLSWQVANLGNAAATVNWTERFFMESAVGQNRTFISQSPYTSGTPLAANGTLARSAQVVMPALINVGDDARFVVEIVPAAGLIELPNSTANNTGTQAGSWVVRKLLKLLVPQTNITEGTVAGVPITVQRTGSIANAQVVTIGMTEATRFSFPATVTILAGQAARSFTVSANDNALLEGPIPASITASATGFAPAAHNVTIIDNESPTLTITGLPATTGEGTSVMFQVVTSFAPTSALQVFLTSSDNTRFPVPASVTIAANATSTNVTVNLPQDQLPELDIEVTITAGAANHAPGTASIDLTDNDVPGLALVLQADTVSESGGAFAVQATLQRMQGSSPIAFTALLTPSLANTLILPASISLPANTNQQTFTIGVIDNALVDGFRTVTINAAVQMAGCGCSAPPLTVANVNTALTVADNDGPSLSVTITPATLAEGLANAGTLRVQRNTSTATALSVNLISSDVTEMTLPASISIPIGATFLNVPITTVNDNTPDGSQQVFVEASASGFAPGITWGIVTDINQPDLVVTALSASTSPWAALVPFTWQATIGNTGFANSIVGTTVRGVLSQNNIVDAGDIVLFDYTINTPVAAGSSVQISGAAVAPNVPGAHKLLIKVNPDAGTSELTYTNNTSQPLNVSISPSYTATAQVAGTSFLRGTTIPVTGTATRPDASPAANQPVEVYVLTNGLRREVLTTTNATGQFTASFVPLVNESGHYTIGASFPGIGQTTTQDAFDILGVRINDGQYPQFVTLIDDTITGTLTIENLSDAPLTDLTLVPSNVPAGAVFTFGTIPSLAGGATTTISYAVSGTTLTSGYNFVPATLTVTSDQGTIQAQDAYYYCQAPGGLISADITSINTTVSQQAGQQLVQIHVINSGAGSTGALSLSLPQVDWLSAMTPVNMPPLPPGDTALVILRFQALTSVPFDLPITGTIALNGTNSNSLVLPFTFTKVSTTVGDLTVDAVNQFTFFDQDEPHVEGATVEVRHAYTNVLLASGTTDVNGQFIATGVPEGTHRLVVTKAQHLPTEQMITISPGASVSQTIFLNYQAITFSWSVVPTGVQDQYDVQLNMVFETNVPMPVVTIDVPDTMPELHGEEVFAFMATLTNHGLITAKDVTLDLQQDHPIYEFVTNYVPADLLAQQSIQVPVLMRRREVPLEGFAGTSVHGVSTYLGMHEDLFRDHETIPIGCKGFAGVMYWYYCSLTTGLWTKGGELYHYLNLSCPDEPGWEFDYTSSGSDPVDIDCPFCPTPPPPGTLGGAFNGIPLTSEKKSCTECIKDVIESIAGCFGADVVGDVFDAFEEGYGQGEAINCALNAQSADDVLQCELDIVKEALKSWQEELTDQLVEALDLPNPVSCVAGLIGAASTCANTSAEAMSLVSSAERSSGSQFDEIIDNLRAWRIAISNLDARAGHYYGPLVDAESWSDLAPQLQPYIAAHESISASAQGAIMNSILGTDINQGDLTDFFMRWNGTIEANGLGIYSPNTSYPDIVDTLLVSQLEDSVRQAVNYALENDFVSLMDMYVKTLVQIFEIIENDNNSVCASVTVQLSQTVTMTREAFRGTLDIFNGHPTDALDSLTVNILITDPNGVPSNGLFQINTEQLTNLSDVTGTGMIPSQEHGIVQFLFIPEPGAAPTEPVLYGFGGSVTYWDPYNEEMTTIELADVTLTVNPSPDLMLHYFMERNILGDDALTSPDVEPSIPAELAVMVENDGYGPAVNMTISSAQPEIVENESGLAINFELTGSNLQGQPAQLGVLNIPFGTIPPLSTRIGQWWFTSSLLGKFVSYEASVVHANSFGNPELSLIQGVELHELTRSIHEYGASGDAMNDFLVNDQFDVNDVPDIIYFSQGNRTAEVIPAGAGNFDMPVQPPTFANTLTMSASEPGWNYLKLNDPGNGDYDLVSVTRQDGQSIPLDNAWLTFVTLPVSQQPVYENKFHIVDSLAGTSPTTYAVVWAPKNTDVPAVDTIQGAPLTVTATQVSHLTVVFDKAIDPGTFTVDDLTLTFQGGPDIMSASANITQLDAFSFDVDLTALTVGNGQYTFIAQAAGVTDVFGLSGVAGKQVSWTQFISVPAIVAFQGLPGGTTDNAFTTIDLLFNLPIDETSLTPADISLTLNGVPQTGALTITRTNNDSTLFQVAGLENVLTTDGSYQLTVDMPNVLSNDGEPGMQAQSIALTLDNSGPTVAQLMPSTTGGLDAQHRTGVLIRFSEPVTGLNTGAVQFTRDGQNLPLNIAQLSQVDADEWQVTGFGLATYPDGDYSFAVSATSVTDAIGNAGTGSLSATWTVDRSTPISVTGVNIDPDLGISNSDGLTSTTSFDALFNLSEDAAQVTISQTSFGSEQILATLQNVTAGSQAVPVTFPTGGNTGLKVTAIGSNGGNAIGTKDLFIDQTPLSAMWQTTADQSLTTDLTSATIQFSADPLDAASIDDAITFLKDGSMLPTGALNITPVNGSTYAITGLASVASGTGSYVLALDASVLHKASSGIAGQGTATLSWTVVPAYTALLSARVFLEGPYSSGAMNDALRQLSGFPLTEPFSNMGYVHTGGGGGETTTAPVLAIPGNDAIVDWVVVELRDADDNSEVVASTSALLQRDGDVVAMDGLSAVNMAVAAGSYHVAIRHRNHLGTMTEDTVTFASGAVNVDFTSLSTDLFGTEPQKQIGARHVLWAGDVSFDNEVQYTGAGNDRDPILVTIGGTTPNNVIYGYHRADVNLDGAVKYTGTVNDRDRILVNVGSTTPTNIRQGQLP